MSFFSRASAKPTPPPPPPADPGLAGYARVLMHGLDEGIKWQRVDPTYFLWLGRRSAEAACLLLLSIHEGKTVVNDGMGGEPSDLPGLIKRATNTKAIDINLKALLEQLRQQGNLGAHVRGPDDDPSPLVRTLAPAWAALLRGLATGPAAAKVPWPIDLAERLKRLEDGGDALSPEEQNARMQQEVGEKRALQLMQERMRAEIEQLRSENAHYKSMLDEAAKDLRRKAWRRRFTLAGLTVVAGGAALSCTGFGGAFGLGFIELGERLQLAAAELSAAPALQTTPGRVDPAAPTTATASALVAAPTPAPVAEPLGPCPAGMVSVAATTLRLGQPIGGRAHWPPPSQKKLPPVKVAAFCLDAAPVSAAEAPGLVGQGCAAPAEGVLAATCLGRDEAEDFCAQRLPGGRLPSIAEWEAVLRLPPRNAGKIDDDGVYREWVADRFPPAIFARHDPTWAKGDGMFRQPLPAQRPPLDAEGNVLWGWSQQAPDSRLGNLGFRCARDAGG